MTAKPIYDYIVGFPGELQDKLEINGLESPLVIWGIEGSKYVNKMTTGVILASPTSLYGPDKPTPPDPKQLRPLDRLVKATFVAGKELYLFEGCFKEGILPEGTIVICTPGWETIKPQVDDPLIKEMFPDVIPAFAAPQTIMAYCNESTDWEWKGYGGWVMLENMADLCAVDSSTLELVAVQQSRQTVRRVAAAGYDLYTGRQFKEGDLVVLPNFRGLECRISTHHPKTKKHGHIVNFVNGDLIFAILKNMKNKFVIKPLHDFVLIKPDEDISTIGANVILPQESTIRPERGTIIEVGPSVPSGLSKGTKVLYKEKFGVLIEATEGPLFLMRSTDLFTTLIPDENGYTLG